ncbi:MAG: hypothetical protein MJ078_04835, partial [Clostridia bacterium]|nr:hypothetical protein [Clostridia bacterium]
QRGTPSIVRIEKGLSAINAMLQNKTEKNAFFINFSPLLYADRLTLNFSAPSSSYPQNERSVTIKTTVDDDALVVFRELERLVDAVGIGEKRRIFLRRLNRPGFTSGNAQQRRR